VDATGLLGKRFYLQAFTARLSFFTLRGKLPEEVSSLMQSFSTIYGSVSDTATDTQLTFFLASLLHFPALQLLFNFPIPDTKFQE